MAVRTFDGPLSLLNGANFKAAVKQLLEENIVEETPCGCHTFNLVIKDAVHPCKKKVSKYYIVGIMTIIPTQTHILDSPP